MRGALGAFLVAIFAVAGPAAAQDGLPSLDDPELTRVALELAGMWGAGDVEGMAALLDPTGVRLQVPGGGRGTLEPRKARLVLRQFLERYGEGQLRLARATASDGTQARGFAELSWSVVRRGTSEVTQYTLFLGFHRNAEGWRVYEIRVLR